MTDELLKIPVDALDSEDKDKICQILVETQNSSNQIVEALLEDQFRKLSKSMEEI